MRCSWMRRSQLSNIEIAERTGTGWRSRGTYYNYFGGGMQDNQMEKQLNQTGIIDEDGYEMANRVYRGGAAPR